MKKYIFILLFFSIAMSAAQSDKEAKRISGKDSAAQMKSVLNLQQTIIKDLKKQVLANQDTISELSVGKVKKVFIKRYIKVYRTVPIYVPIIDSVAYLKVMKDTLQDYFLDSTQKPKKHRSRNLFSSIFKRN